MTNDNICPCKGCTTETGRTPGCHSECRRYIEWNDKRKEDQDMIRKQIIQQRMILDDANYRIMHSRRVIHQHHR